MGGWWAKYVELQRHPDSHLCLLSGVPKTLIAIAFHRTVNDSNESHGETESNRADSKACQIKNIIREILKVFGNIAGPHT